jgi:hypothetical protein
VILDFVHFVLFRISGIEHSAKLIIPSEYIKRLIGHNRSLLVC